MELVRVFFFFQAEDGIRDHCVTGVQTCALPISVSLPVHPGPEMAAYCVPTAVRPKTWAGGLGYDVSKRRVGTCRTHDVSLPPSSRRKDRRRGRSPRRFTLPRTRCRITSRRSLIRWVYAVGAS